MGLNAETLSAYLNVECTGLLGADVLSEFDYIFDISKGILTVSSEEIESEGESLPLSEFMGIPIVTVQIKGSQYNMFFDTGAQISYLQDSSITEFQQMDALTDFYPGFGEFETKTYAVPMTFANVHTTLQCGTLPELLGMTLAMGGTQGILGNEILLERTVRYFPRRSLLCL